jgi:hypothetical protein
VAQREAAGEVLGEGAEGAVHGRAAAFSLIGRKATCRDPGHGGAASGGRRPLQTYAVTATHLDGHGTRATCEAAGLVANIDPPSAAAPSTRPSHCSPR